MTNLRNRALLLAALFSTCTTCLAALVQGDDFNDNVKDTMKWGPDIGDAGTALTETNMRLEYTADNTGAQISRIQPWVFHTLTFSTSWEAQVDVHLGTVDAASLPNPSDDVRFSIGVLSGSSSAGISLEVENNQGTVQRSFQFGDEGLGDSGPDVHASTGSQDAALRLVFDATTKILSFFYDDNGAVGGYSWSQLGAIDTDAPGTNWMLSESSVLTTALAGESTRFAVASGLAYGDNFLVSQEIALPGTALLLGLALAGLGFTRRRRLEG